MLNYWEKLESPAAVKHLSNMLIEERYAIFEQQTISGFYDQTNHTEEFISWFLSSNMWQKIEQKYFDYEIESFSENISLAEQIIAEETIKYSNP